MREDAGGAVVRMMTYTLAGMAVATAGYVGLGLPRNDGRADAAPQVASFQPAAQAAPVQIAPVQIAPVQIAYTDQQSSRPPGLSAPAVDARPQPRPVWTEPVVHMTKNAPPDTSFDGEDLVTRGSASPLASEPAKPLRLKATADATPATTPETPSDTLPGTDQRVILSSNSPQVQPLAASRIPATPPIARPAALTHPLPDTYDSHAALQIPASTACVAELQQVADRTRIYFDEASSAVTGEGRLRIAAFGRMLRACPAAQVTIYGFTDPTGNPTANLSLSWQRARNVHDTLIAQGIPASQVTAKSHLEGHRENCEHYDVVDRRVEFEVTQQPTGRG
ncbi:OmpA family protein [Sagittula sp. S175]|uniref:OmpA family protein n=1 Tax=Sagittula sp. S175 TaxID=3415129 RepID=UPI003C7AC2AA